MNFLILSLSTLCFTLLLTYYTASAFQWFSYKLDRVLFHFAKPRWHLFFFVLPLAAFELALWLKNPLFVAGVTLVFGGIIWRWKSGLDKPLVFTNRIKRLFGFIIVLFAFSFIIKISPALMPIFALVFGLIFSALSEVLIAKRFQQLAQKKLQQNQNLKIILITASFGKTSIKNFIYELLKINHICHKTPRSVNTFGGIVRDINENLTAGCEFYIVEAGARKCGDIAEITRFLNPQIVVVGQVGKAHIEYFKTTENIRKTKLEALQSERLEAVFLHSSTRANANLNGANNANASDLSDKKTTAADASNSNLNEVLGINCPQLSRVKQENVIFYDEKISQIKASLSGLEFVLKLPAKQPCESQNSRETNTPICELYERETNFSSNLLGDFNAQNLAAAILIANHVSTATQPQNANQNATLAQLQSAVKHMPCVEHRLQPIRAGAKLIIDDSFNGNFNGMRTSYELARTWAGRKVLLTPGLVEVETAQNEALGALINEIFDIVVITSELNAAALSRHITKPTLVRLFDKGKMQEWLLENTRGGDLILFSNDAPSFI